MFNLIIVRALPDPPVEEDGYGEYEKVDGVKDRDEYDDVELLEGGELKGVDAIV